MQLTHIDNESTWAHDHFNSCQDQTNGPIMTKFGKFEGSIRIQHVAGARTLTKALLPVAFMRLFRKSIDLTQMHNLCNGQTNGRNMTKFAGINFRIKCCR